MAEEQRYCSKCGAPLKSGVAFCTACGTKVAQGESRSAPTGTDEVPSADTSAVDSGGESMAEQGQATGARPRKRRKLPVIAAVVVILICVGVGIGFATGAITQLLSPAVTFGSDQTIAASRSALFVPKDADGSPLVHYFVRLVKAQDADGNEIDVSAMASLEVTSDEGFSFDSALGDLPDGTYYAVVVQDDGTLWEMPPVEVSDSGSASTVEVDQSPDSPAAENEADRLFLEKLQSYIAAYQLPSITTIEPSSDSGPYVSYIQNLAYAQLVDFGDGRERLVMAYLNDSGRTHEAFEMGGGAQCYTIEVWGYDPETGTLLSQYKDYANGSISEGALSTAVGNAFVDYTANPDTGKLCLSSFDQSGSNGVLEQKFYSPDDGGSFEMVKDFDHSSVAEEPYHVFYIDGVQTDEASFLSALDEWQVSNCYLMANTGDSEDEARTNRQSKYSSGSVDTSVVKNIEETCDTVQATRDELMRRTGLSEEDLSDIEAAEVSTPDAAQEGEEESAFYDKVQELCDTYGGTSSTSIEAANGQVESYAEGLCFARLIDFGDGENRLMVAFNDPQNASNGSISTDVFGRRYTIQIWEYDADSQEAELVWEGPASQSNGGFSAIALYQDADGKIYFDSYGFGGQGIACISVTSSGSMGRVYVPDDTSWALQEWYYLVYTGNTIEEALEDSGTYDDPTFITYSISDCIGTVSDTEAQLLSISGDA